LFSLNPKGVVVFDAMPTPCVHTETISRKK
jgi:hypothetical protein